MKGLSKTQVQDLDERCALSKASMPQKAGHIDMEYYGALVGFSIHDHIQFQLLTMCIFNCIDNVSL